MKSKNKKLRTAFTLPEILIAVGLFAAVSTVVSGLYVNTFRELRRANSHNETYDDARYILESIANEVRNGTIDYDEYYNQNVVVPALQRNAIALNGAIKNYGGNYGRYFSSFFNPGSDNKLGFACNDGGKRNRRDCTPLKKTRDRNTGTNPFVGKFDPTLGVKEDAFCGTVNYFALNQGSIPVPWPFGECDRDGKPDPKQERAQNELYLISADAKTKTIILKEAIGLIQAGGKSRTLYALSMLKLDGYDLDGDGVPDHYACGKDFRCTGTDDIPGITSQPVGECEGRPGELPPPRNLQFAPTTGINPVTGEFPDVSNNNPACDTRDVGFSKDFVPISPLRVIITDLKFYITPSEDPHYAFAEDDKRQQEQPRVTIVITIAPNPSYTTGTETFQPLTLVETVSTRTLAPIPAPLLAE